MRCSSGILCFFGLSLILIVGLFGLNCQADDKDAATSNKQLTARDKFTLAKLFDFERYKTLFNKRYASLVEQAARARLFLGRAFRVFISAISYKKRRTSFYLAINQMSDWTPDEISAIGLRFRGAKEILQVGDDDDLLGSEQASRKADEPEPVASLDEIEEAIDDLNKREPVLKLLADREKRELKLTPSRHISLNDLAREPTQKDNDASELVESNNPQYEPPELIIGSDKSKSQHGSSMEQFLSRPGKQLPNASGKNFISWATNKLFGKNKQSSEQKNIAIDMNLPDEIFIDHRDECMFAPRNQGKCGSCYAFAAVTIFEWLYCKATGFKVAFSEQYILDCGDKDHGIYGCSGGHTIRVPEFVRENGLELRENYPYRERTDQCPYDKSTPNHIRGYLRVAVNSVKPIRVDDFEQELIHNPMVIPVFTGPTFHEYGGGVHDGAECNRMNGHAMVLVGSGREDNEEYWLIRNSFSATYGEAGYYKLTKKAKNCIENQNAYLFSRLTGFENERGLNQQHEATPIKQRYHQYVTLQTSPLNQP